MRALLPWPPVALSALLAALFATPKLTASPSPVISSMSTLLKFAAPGSVHGYSLIRFSFFHLPKIVDNDGQAGVRRQPIATTGVADGCHCSGLTSCSGPRDGQTRVLTPV